MSLNFQDILFTEDGCDPISDGSPERVIPASVDSILDSSIDEKYLSAEEGFVYDDSIAPDLEAGPENTHYKSPKQRDRVALSQDEEGKLPPEMLDGYLNFISEQGMNLLDMKKAIESKFSSKTIQNNKSYIASRLHKILTERKKFSYQTNLKAPEYTPLSGHHVGANKTKKSFGDRNPKLVKVSQIFLSELKKSGWFLDIERKFSSSFPEADIAKFRKDFTTKLVSALDRFSRDLPSISKDSVREHYASFLPGKKVTVATAVAIDKQGYEDSVLTKLNTIAASVAGELFSELEYKVSYRNRKNAGSSATYSEDVFNSLSEVSGIQELSEALNDRTLSKRFVSSAKKSVEEKAILEAQKRKVVSCYVKSLASTGWIKYIKSRFVEKFPNSDVRVFEKKLVSSLSKEFKKYFDNNSVKVVSKTVSKEFVPPTSVNKTASDLIKDKRLSQKHVDNLSLIAGITVENIFSEATLKVFSSKRQSSTDIDYYSLEAHQHLDNAITEIDSLDTSYGDSGFSVESIDFGASDLLENESNISTSFEESFFVNE